LLKKVEDSLEWNVDRTPKFILYITSHPEKYDIGCPLELCSVHFLRLVTISRIPKYEFQKKKKKKKEANKSTD
jgi:hypothetical protein